MIYFVIFIILKCQIKICFGKAINPEMKSGNLNRSNSIQIMTWEDSISGDDNFMMADLSHISPNVIIAMKLKSNDNVNRKKDKDKTNGKETERENDDFSDTDKVPKAIEKQSKRNQMAGGFNNGTKSPELEQLLTWTEKLPGKGSFTFADLTSIAVDFIIGFPLVKPNDADGDSDVKSDGSSSNQPEEDQDDTTRKKKFKTGKNQKNIEIEDNKRESKKEKPVEPSGDKEMNENEAKDPKISSKTKSKNDKVDVKKPEIKENPKPELNDKVTELLGRERADSKPLGGLDDFATSQLSDNFHLNMFLRTLVVDKPTGQNKNFQGKGKPVEVEVFNVDLNTKGQYKFFNLSIFAKNIFIGILTNKTSSTNHRVSQSIDFDQWSFEYVDPDEVKNLKQNNSSQKTQKDVPPTKSTQESDLKFRIHEGLGRNRTSSQHLGSISDFGTSQLDARFQSMLLGGAFRDLKLDDPKVKGGKLVHLKSLKHNLLNKINYDLFPLSFLFPGLMVGMPEKILRKTIENGSDSDNSTKRPTPNFRRMKHVEESQKNSRLRSSNEIEEQHKANEDKQKEKDSDKSKERVNERDSQNERIGQKHHGRETKKDFETNGMKKNGQQDDEKNLDRNKKERPDDEGESENINDPKKERSDEGREPQKDSEQNQNERVDGESESENMKDSEKKISERNDEGREPEKDLEQNQNDRVDGKRESENMKDSEKKRSVRNDEGQETKQDFDRNQKERVGGERESKNMKDSEKKRSERNFEGKETKKGLVTIKKGKNEKYMEKPKIKFVHPIHESKDQGKGIQGYDSRQMKDNPKHLVSLAHEVLGRKRMSSEQLGSHTDFGTKALSGDYDLKLHL